METKIVPAGSRLAEKYPMIAYLRGDVMAVPSFKKAGVYVLPGHIETSAEELVVNGFTPKITPLWSRFWIEVQS
jgi:hypothetical protein